MTDISATYAQALYTLAKDEGLAETLLQQLQTLQTVFTQESDFVHLLANPGISKQERCALIQECLGQQVHPYLLNFLKILTEKGGIRHFDGCVKSYREQYNADNGIIPVLAVTAVALTLEQSSRLRQKLEQITGKTVELTNRVDPDCLGGVRLDFDGKRMDGTVKNRLDTLRSQLNNTVL